MLFVSSQKYMQSAFFLKSWCMNCKAKYLEVACVLTFRPLYPVPSFIAVNWFRTVTQRCRTLRTISNGDSWEQKEKTETLSCLRGFRCCLLFIFGNRTVENTSPDSFLSIYSKLAQPSSLSTPMLPPEADSREGQSWFAWQTAKQVLWLLAQFQKS